MATIDSYNKRLEALSSERTSFMPLWRELSDYHLAYRGRFLLSDRNNGHKRNTKQLNNTSRLAARTTASGMMSGITSPARPWFRLSSGDKKVDDVAAVKQWMFDVQNIMYRVFSASNLYNSLHQTYSELGVFGVGVMGVYEDYENVIHCRPYTVGSYMLGADDRNLVDTLYREYEITVGQLVKQFGVDKVSMSTRNQWEAGNTEVWVPVVHVIEPNDDRDMQSPLASEKPWRSVYYEKSEKTPLRESGFDEFPIMAPRWDITGEDIYATDCPGITTLGDTKGLQLGERRLYQAVDRLVDPPLQGPSTMRNKMKGNTPAPGEVIWHDQPDSKGLRSIYDGFRPDLNALQLVNTNAEERIKRGFYEDLFLMLANSDRRQITAREVAEKHEEKLLMLGPVLERLHTELLDPLIDRTFNILQRNGVLPVPPPELKDVSVEYVSVLAQAQRLVNTGAIDRMVEHAGQLASIWPEARHKIDPNTSIDEYADALGVNPAIIRSDRDADARAAAELQAQQQAQQMEQAKEMMTAASQASISPDNVLGATLENQ